MFRLVWPPVFTVLATDRSKLWGQGDSTPGSARGALPKVFSADVENAAC
jgi:hypothetical protein